MRPSRVLWWLVLAELVVVVSVPALRRGVAPVLVLRPASLPPHAEQRAQRLNTPWAWAAYAEGQPPASDAQWAAFGHALALDPRDEVALVRRAELWAAAKDASPARTTEAVAALVRERPDNAVGHWLQALLDCRSGRREAALAALRRGNRAARCEPCQAQAELGYARFAGRGVVWNADLSLTALNGWRSLARGLAPTHRDAAGLPSALELARLGARLRDESDLYISALVGVAVQSIAFAAGAPPAPAHESKEQADARMLSLARDFDRRLVGLEPALPAGWAEAEARRSQAVRTAVREAAREMWPVRGPLGAALAWCGWAGTLLAASLLTLASLLPGRLRRERPAPLAWTWGDLRLLALTALVPALAFAAVAVHGVYSAGLRQNGDGQTWRLACLALAPWMPLVLVRLALAGCGRQAALRAAEPLARRAFVRRSWQPVGSALAATLVLLALAASGPAGWYTRQLLGTSIFDHERAVLRSVRP